MQPSIFVELPPHQEPNETWSRAADQYGVGVGDMIGDNQCGALFGDVLRSDNADFEEEMGQAPGGETHERRGALPRDGYNRDQGEKD